jgi:hypothetical protein
MASNPVPRAALSHEGDAVVRPALRRTSEVTPSPAVTPASPPAPSPTDALVGVAAPASGEGHPKHKGKKHKGEHHKAGKHETAETVELVVTLAKPVRRTLKTAAAERETTPEALASLVLTAWLER